MGAAVLTKRQFAILEAMAAGHKRGNAFLRVPDLVRADERFAGGISWAELAVLVDRGLIARWRGKQNARARGELRIWLSADGRKALREGLPVSLPRGRMSEEGIAALYAGQRYEDYRGRELLDNTRVSRAPAEIAGRGSSCDGSGGGHAVRLGRS